MTPVQRRESILSCLSHSDQPVTAAALASRLQVSRQVIVGDVALLRAGGAPIAATPRGYVLQEPEGFRERVVCCHTASQMEEELNLLVDLGCVVEDVSVEHPIYGQLTGQLALTCRADVALFLQRTRQNDAKPLSALTEGIHTHTLRCASRETLQRAREALRWMGILQE